MLSDYTTTEEYGDLISKHAYVDDGLGTGEFYQQFDAQYAANALLDDSGERFVYDAYGNHATYNGNWTTQSDSLQWNYTFQGGRQDAVTGLIHFGAREYSPALMRFTRTDPLGDVNGLDDYLLDGDNTLTRMDPEGTDFDAQSYGGYLVMPSPTYTPEKYVDPTDEITLGHNLSTPGFAGMIANPDKNSTVQMILHDANAISTAVNNVTTTADGILQDPGQFVRDLADTSQDGEMFDSAQGCVEEFGHDATFGLYPVSNDPLYGNQDAYQGGMQVGDAAYAVDQGLVMNAVGGYLMGPIADAWPEAEQTPGLFDMSGGEEPTGIPSVDGCGTDDGCFTAGTKVLTNVGRMSIEQVRIGQRVITRPSGMEELEQPKIDPEKYRIIRLEYAKPGANELMNLALLRPAHQTENLGLGDTITLSILELEVEGKARVLGIEPCPAIDQGPGELVTGTVNNQNLDVRLLYVEGLEKPIEATGGHPVYSEDRQAFVAVKDLQRGERLRTRGGIAYVERIDRHYGSVQVFNLEIGRVHQYYVSELDVLVHNSVPCFVDDAAENAGATNPLFQPGPYAGESIPAQSTAQTFTPAERAAINDIGYDTGCHTCGTTDPGTVSGNFVPDHQPVSALNTTNAPQQLYPQCKSCSSQQGLAVIRALREAQQ